MRRMETSLGGEASCGIYPNCDHTVFWKVWRKKDKVDHVAKAKAEPSMALLVTGSCLPPGLKS